GEKSYRHAQNDANPKPPSHVDQLRIDFFLQSYGSRFEGHTAYGTETRLRADDLRVHRKHVLCLDCSGGRSGRFYLHPTPGARAWFGLAHFGIHRTDILTL